MGFSLVAAAAIIGVSVLIAIEVFVGSTIPVFTDVHESFNNMKNRAIDQVKTDIISHLLQLKLMEQIQI